MTFPVCGLEGEEDCPDQPPPPPKTTQPMLPRHPQFQPPNSLRTYRRKHHNSKHEFAHESNDNSKHNTTHKGTDQGTYSKNERRFVRRHQ
mmetsp:Transcript_19134/g.19432  ORF Transcript_19134/g.19432 Transcript_19134/m.19432 type:complete len:90 (+) Transcript_19134:367-636(+)